MSVLLTSLFILPIAICFIVACYALTKFLLDCLGTSYEPNKYGGKTMSKEAEQFIALLKTLRDKADGVVILDTKLLVIPENYINILINTVEQL